MLRLCARCGAPIPSVRSLNKCRPAPRPPIPCHQAGGPCGPARYGQPPPTVAHAKRHHGGQSRGRQKTLIDAHQFPTKGSTTTAAQRATTGTPPERTTTPRGPPPPMGITPHNAEHVRHNRAKQPPPPSHARRSGLTHKAARHKQEREPPIEGGTVKQNPCLPRAPPHHNPLPP